MPSFKCWIWLVSSSWSLASNLKLTEFLQRMVEYSTRPCRDEQRDTEAPCVVWKYSTMPSLSPGHCGPSRNCLQRQRSNSIKLSNTQETADTVNRESVMTLCRNGSIADGRQSNVSRGVWIQNDGATLTASHVSLPS